MKIIFATNNIHKVTEVRAMLEPQYEIIGLSDLSFNEDIAETADTLEGNALLKAQYVYRKFGIDCFADDTGLEIDALDGEPGVYSARYAGRENNAIANMEKVLVKLGQNSHRNAYFRTVIVLLQGGKKHYFEGKIEGSIAFEALGEKGFGYDPIFIPKGYQESFAQMLPEIKNRISHRAIAIQKLKDHLLV